MRPKTRSRPMSTTAMFVIVAFLVVVGLLNTFEFGRPD